jgi:hypothetical protein
MRAFEVSLNRKKLCAAGIGDEGVLTTIVSWVTAKNRSELSLDVAGLVSSTDEHVSWVRQKSLCIGDRIEIRIVEATSVDTPKRRHREDPRQRVRSQRRYVREMAKQLGWKILARSKKSV